MPTLLLQYVMISATIYMLYFRALFKVKYSFIIPQRAPSQTAIEKSAQISPKKG